MSIRKLELIINENEPFEGCELNRERYADILTSIVRSYDDGFVLAINNKWGAGKTTFVKMWEAKLKSQKYRTIYFNAWENDFEDNPLIALMGELKTLTSKTTEKKFKSVLKKASVLSKHIAPILVKAIADKYVDTNSAKEAFVEISKGITDIFENEVNQYIKKKESIQNFKNSLAKFIADTNRNVEEEIKPVVFIVDELDRCRPNYAVLILEQIKHFFSIPNIVFVLSIDKVQLGHAICGVYGSDKIDSEEYLRRFIDIEYTIPNPEEDTYYKYLYDYFKLSNFFNESEKDDFNAISQLLFSDGNVSLRQQEKIFALTGLSLKSFSSRVQVVPGLFLFLVFIKIMDTSFYNEFKNKKLSVEKIQHNFYNHFKNKIDDRFRHKLLFLEAYLLVFNFHFNNPNSRDRLYNYDKETGENILSIESIIGSEIFLGYIVDVYRSVNTLELNDYITRIDLLESVNTNN
ncbi:P-loop NTPase fold protein [Zobellia sp. 1_MG-2023]|uniref:KAP family P-loop NTPase fold protein n=1 Tax=Zobellia sp. 1_MG-2023 TaxID=3062626 RepID=UPI0026E1607F|nr:P-loop NTPase fold protein [Zobellia sp. 1_MG-2023]MDO6820339.1 P-loop NTPase fold protein [Zobellia sp. 1_MG-2023]